MTLLIGTIVGATVLTIGISTAGPAKPLTGAVAMTAPSCEAYQRERPRGGPFEQLSDLFNLSIYRWDEADYGRYRTFMLDCKRSLLGFRDDQTFPQWEALTEKSVAGLKSYTGFVNRLGEPMANRFGPRPAPGVPDETRAFETLSCDRFTSETVNTWRRGGPPDYGPEAPFGVPVANWTYEIWRALENRIVTCGQQTGSPVEADRDWIGAVVSGVEARASGEIRQARQDEGARAAKATGILARLAEAERLTSADELAGKLTAVEALAAAGPKLRPADEKLVSAARGRIVDKLRTARMAESEAWERDRPAREARAHQQEEELAGLQRGNREREATQGEEFQRLQHLNQEREAGAAAERERATRIEAERQAPARALAERQAREAEEARKLNEAEATAERQRREQAEAAADPCNQTQTRRQMMDAANKMDQARYSGSKLLDLTNGRTLSEDSASARSCRFMADWSSGQRGFVTITVRKNSFGDDLIEVRRF